MMRLSSYASEKPAKILAESIRGEVKQESLDSFLTKRQVEVLQLRHQGYTPQKVADKLGTSRSNIYMLEKDAHRNIERAKRTLQQWMRMRAPISLKVETGMDAFDLPDMIFEAADKMGIELPVTSLDIIMQLSQESPRLFLDRVLERDAEIFVTGDGEILLWKYLW
jgi:Tfx family DNA-binding protein